MSASEHVTRRGFLKLGVASALSASTEPLLADGHTGPVTTVNAPGDSESLADLVNPLQGTDSSPAFSRGNTLPIVALPFGMAHWSMQSNHESPWFFRPREQRLQGIRCTHQLSPWLSDYGHATFLPFRGDVNFEPGQRASSYRPQDMKVAPYHLSVRLLRYRCTMELVPTERCCRLRITFDDSGPAGLLVDLSTLDSAILPTGSTRSFAALTRVNAGGVPKGFAAHYRVETETIDLRWEEKQLRGRRVAALHFEATGGKPIEFRIATSFISDAQAARNMQLEVNDSTFDQLLAASRAVWNKALGRVQIREASGDQKRIFYSALYRAVLFPRIWHEPDATGQMMHFSPYTGELRKGVMYADHGYWDNYRAWYPMMSLLFPDRLGEILQAWVNAYEEGGWLPQFPCPGYRACMTGSLIDSVFGDAVAKGITGFDVKTAYAGLKKHATQPGNPSAGFGRRGLEEYMQRGWVPCDLVDGGAVETLDSAYGDFCIAQVARAAGELTDAALFEKRSLGWRAQFDPTTKFIRGKVSSGQWVEPFSPYRWGNPYVEGSAWQYRFSAPHDTDFLIHAFGGPQPFVQALEEMLSQSPRFEVGSYGQEIHEMSEMAAVNFGQYAHSNQPVHHVLYLFSVAGRRDRTQYWVHRVLNELYSPDTFAGDEDTGSMSAWYVLGALGLFSHCPGKPDWTLGTPLFPEANISLSNGRTLRIEARPRRSGAFLGNVTVNGTKWDSNYLPHTTLLDGAHLIFSD